MWALVEEGAAGQLDLEARGAGRASLGMATPGCVVRIEDMALVGVILGAVGIALATTSIVLVFAVERARAPRIVVEPGERYWPEDSPFAHVAVRNERPSGWLGRHFRGVTATNCRASIEFHHDGERVLGPIPARWSGAPEPYLSRDLMESYRWDLAATGQAEQIAIAYSCNIGVYAFSGGSYRHELAKPDWRLEPGAYVVEVRLAASEVEAMETLRLIVGGDGEVQVEALWP